MPDQEVSMEKREMDSARDRFLAAANAWEFAAMKYRKMARYCHWPDDKDWQEHCEANYERCMDQADWHRERAAMFEEDVL